MSRAVEAPQVVESAEGEDRCVYRHPAFASIQVSRVSGDARLYGSDFKHQHFIRVRVEAAELHRDYSRDWSMPRHAKSYIEVDMSEAQWAAHVSAIGSGAGTQCTLVSFNGGSVPGLPDPEPRTEQFAKEVQGRLSGVRQHLDNLKEKINSSSLSGKAKAELLSHIHRAGMDLGVNLEFVASQFDEHMEQTVQRAKVEINAYASAEMTRAGLSRLPGAAPLSVADARAPSDEAP